MGGNGPVALNTLAIDIVFNYMEVPLDERADLLMKIQTIAASCINSQHEEQIKKQAASNK